MHGSQSQVSLMMVTMIIIVIFVFIFAFFWIRQYFGTGRKHNFAAGSKSRLGREGHLSQCKSVVIFKSGGRARGQHDGGGRAAGGSRSDWDWPPYVTGWNSVWHLGSIGWLVGHFLAGTDGGGGSWNWKKKNKLYFVGLAHFLVVKKSLSNCY